MQIKHLVLLLLLLLYEADEVRHDTITPFTEVHAGFSNNYTST